MIIDAHNHPDWHKHNLDKFLENMATYNIDKTWLLSWECPKDEYAPAIYNCSMLSTEGGPIPFSRCLRYKERAPDKFILGYAPDPRRPEAIDSLEAAIDVYGVQVYGELKLRMLYDNPDALRMFRFCGEKGLPVTVHLDYEFDTGSTYPRPNWWYGGPIEAFERAVRACPETNFIGHAPGFWAHISGDDQFDKVGYPNGPVVPGGKLPDDVPPVPQPLRRPLRRLRPQRPLPRSGLWQGFRPRIPGSPALRARHLRQPDAGLPHEPRFAGGSSSPKFTRAMRCAYLSQ